MSATGQLFNDPHDIYIFGGIFHHFVKNGNAFAHDSSMNAYETATFTVYSVAIACFEHAFRDFVRCDSKACHHILTNEPVCMWKA